MNYRVTITGPAERDIRHNTRWWSENRSAEEADRWYLGVYAAMQSLRHMPERHGYADEKELMGEEIRQMGFGLGSRPTHRIVYAVVGDEVVIYRIRAGRQGRLRLADLEASDSRQE